MMTATTLTVRHTKITDDTAVNLYDRLWIVRGDGEYGLYEHDAENTTDDIPVGRVIDDWLTLEQAIDDAAGRIALDDAARAEIRAAFGADAVDVEIADAVRDEELMDVLATRDELRDDSNGPAIVTDTAGGKQRLVEHGEPLTSAEAYRWLTGRARDLMTADTDWDTIRTIDPDLADEWMQSDACDDVIAEIADEHNLMSEQVSARLEAGIPDGDTPRESIQAAADACQRVEDMDGGDLLDYVRLLAARIKATAGRVGEVEIVRGHYDRLVARTVAIIQDADSFAEVARAASALHDAAQAMSDAAGEDA